MCSFERPRTYLSLVIGLLAAAYSLGAAEAQVSPITSHLEGRITVSAEIDSSQDYSGFTILVGAGTEEGGLDTLGTARTARSGEFAMDIQAPGRGVYSVLISRSGNVLTIGDIAVAEGDSAKLRIEYPVSTNWLPIRSRENASWLAYNNTRIQHTRELAAMFEAQETVSGDTLAAHFRQTANIMWNLRRTFPNTIGSEFAGAESISLLEGWDDSLAVAWAEEISPSNGRYATVGRTVRRATARLEGQESALSVLRNYRDRAIGAADRAELQAEIVRAHLDSLETEQAVAAARILREEYPDTPWADWAERAEYEANNLMPGMAAPDIMATTDSGESFSLENLKGNTVVLEFWAPQSSQYRRQLPQVNQLTEQVVSDSVRWVAVNVESNREMYDAFAEGRTLPGTQVQTTNEQSESIVKRYNISSLPTRIIIDENGHIVGKYIGSVASLRGDLLRYLDISTAQN